MIRLEDFIGENVAIWTTRPFKRGETKYYVAKLRGVEAGGIWIESEDLTGIFLAGFHKTKDDLSGRSPVFFFPFWKIESLTLLGIELDPKEFGMQDD
ncbi:hypothetical protein LCGC14_1698350 [marine sediment metagenome]|uniref:Uncharacterized protein n=1 Tax=marine sediment metagenome TaxID=412755 RepID=A0A0F9I6C8_9ZZZZ